MSDLKTMSVKEFWEKGILQELNRQFLHPLGLALSVVFDEEDDDKVEFGEIWDYRDDPEGMMFGPAPDEAAHQTRLDKAAYVEQLQEMHKDVRIEMFGSVIQSLDEESDRTD